MSTAAPLQFIKRFRYPLSFFFFFFLKIIIMIDERIFEGYVGEEGNVKKGKCDRILNGMQKDEE